MQIKSNHLLLLACPTHDQCKIHIVYTSRNKILLGHKSKVLKTYYQYLKVLKKMLQNIETITNTNTEYKTELIKAKCTKVLNKSSKSVNINQQL